MNRLQRSRKALEARGYAPWKVEYWNHYSRRLADLYGFIDLLALHPDGHLLGVQVCDSGSRAAHERKILAAEHYPAWVKQHDLELHSWRKNAKGRWVCKVEEL